MVWNPKCKCQNKTRWWFLICFLCSPLFGEDFHPFWRAYFSNGLVQPPTRKHECLEVQIGWYRLLITPQKFNIAPKKRQSPKGNSSSNHHFSGAMLNFGGVLDTFLKYYWFFVQFIQVFPSQTIVFLNSKGLLYMQSTNPWTSVLSKDLESWLGSWNMFYFYPESWSWDCLFDYTIFKKHVVFKKQSTRWFPMAGKKQLSNEKTLVV